MNTERRNTLTGLMFGMTEFVSHRELASAAGFNSTDVYNELREMEVDGLVESDTIHSQSRHRSQPQKVWRLKQTA